MKAAENGDGDCIEENDNVVVLSLEVVVIAEEEEEKLLSGCLRFGDVLDEEHVSWDLMRASTTAEVVKLLKTAPLKRLTAAAAVSVHCDRCPCFHCERLYSIFLLVCSF